VDDITTGADLDSSDTAPDDKTNGAGLDSRDVADETAVVIPPAAVDKDRLTAATSSDGKN